jgi:hypothetical protein
MGVRIMSLILIPFRKLGSRNAASKFARLVLAFLAAFAVFVLSAVTQDSKSPRDKKLDIRSSVGDLHVGTDVDAGKIGLPVYPGARLRQDTGKDGNDSVNLGISLESFGVKLVIAKYESDDAPGKIIDFYRGKLKRYGKVLECHTHQHDRDFEDHDDQESKELKCEGDNSGPVTELRVGTEDNQHVVAIEPRDNGTGSTFALVYLHVRGKQGEI